MWAPDMYVGLTPAGQWRHFMIGVFMLGIPLTLWLAFDTVRLLTILALHAIKKMVGMSPTSARIQTIQSDIHSNSLYLTNRIQHAWARLQCSLETIFDFCSQHHQSSSHYGWMIPILVIMVIVEPRLIFSDLIPSMMDASSEWTTETMRPDSPAS